VWRRAVELGITLIDTADSYGPRVAERLIAEALHPYRQDSLLDLQREGKIRYIGLSHRFIVSMFGIEA
jgi:aryl-alcohol dehydrogenase-like predicted oxidoreductase